MRLCPRRISIVVLSVVLPGVLSAFGCVGDDPARTNAPGVNPPDDDAAATQAVTITPSDAKLGLGETQAFVANVPATFRVVEGAGGTVDEAGLYTAPRAFGTYHVEAESTLDPNQKVTATITVVPRLELLAGKVGGGAGNVDGKGNAARFFEPKAIAVDASALYVADTGNHTIRKADLTTGEVTLVAGRPGLFGHQDGPAAASLFRSPSGIAYEGGSLFVTELAGLRRINLNTQVVSTISGISSPRAVVSDRQGNVYVATSSSSGILYKVNAATGAVTQLQLKTGGSPSALSINLLAWDGTSILAVGSGGLLRVNAGSGEYTTLTPTCSQADPYCYFAPESMTVTGHYLAYTTSFTGAVHLLDLDDLSRVIGSSAIGVGSEDGIGPAARMYLPTGIAGDSAGNLFVTDTMNHTIRKIVVATQQVSTPFGTPGFWGDADGVGEAARFRRPTTVAVQEGAAYVGDPTNNRRLAKIDLATGGVSTWMSASSVTPTTVVAGPPGSLYVSGANGFAEVDIASKQLIFPSGGGLPAAGLAFNGGTVFYAYQQQLLRSSLPITTNVELAGALTTRGFADGAGAAARFDEPRGLAVDTQGRLFVADKSNHAIRAVTITDGVVTTPFGAGGIAGVDDGAANAARFTHPEALALDGKGNLYVADTGNATIRRIDLATSAVTTLIGDPGKSAVRLGLAPAGLSRPTGIALTPEGDLLIVDNGENAVLLVRLH